MEKKKPRLKRRGKWWYVEYYVVDGVEDTRVRQSLKTTDESEAEKKLVEITFKRNEATLQKPSRSFLFEIAEAYAQVRKADLSKKNADSEAGRIRLFFEALPRRITRLEQLNSRLILLTLTKMMAERKWKKKTFNEYRLALRGLFKYAINFCGFVSTDPRHENPAAAVDRLKVPQTTIIYLTRQQIRA